MTAVTIPDTLGEIADQLYQTRESRLALQKTVDKFKSDEEALSAVLVKKLEAAKTMTGVAGRIARAELVPDVKPELTSWPKFCAFVAKKKAFDLLERRIGKNAWKALHEKGTKVPGVRAEKTTSLSVTKL